MQTTVQKWGNSLAVRIPKAFAAEAGLAEDSPVELSLSDGRLILTPVVAVEPTLDSLLAAITPDNIHQELAMDGPPGNEVW